MSIATLNDIFFAAVERNLDRIMLYRHGGKWLPISSREFSVSVARTARALHGMGIRPEIVSPSLAKTPRMARR